MLGASFDTPAENKEFARAQGFEFRLLSDVERTTAAAYEVTRDDDDQYADFPRRVSYLIDRDGVIARAYAVTDVAAHADVVLHDLATLDATR